MFHFNLIVVLLHQQPYPGGKPNFDDPGQCLAWDAIRAKKNTMVLALGTESGASADVVRSVRQAAGMEQWVGPKLWPEPHSDELFLRMSSDKASAMKCAEQFQVPPLPFFFSFLFVLSFTLKLEFWGMRRI